MKSSRWQLNFHCWVNLSFNISVLQQCLCHCVWRWENRVSLLSASEKLEHHRLSRPKPLWGKVSIKDKGGGVGGGGEMVIRELNGSYSGSDAILETWDVTYRNTGFYCSNRRLCISKSNDILMSVQDSLDTILDFNASSDFSPGWFWDAFVWQAIQKYPLPKPRPIFHPSFRFYVTLLTNQPTNTWTQVNT